MVARLPYATAACLEAMFTYAYIPAEGDSLLACEHVAHLATSSQSQALTSFIAISMIVTGSGPFGWRRTAMTSPI